MADKTAELALRISSDASDAVRGLDSVGDAATAMANEVERAARSADTAVSRMDNIAAAADNLDSKSAAATGSLGALSSGFELVGAEKYAVGLQSAALATDFLSGVGQSLNLIMNLQALATVRARAATIAHSAANKAAAASQWLLNTALLANPIGLTVAAVIAAVALFVLLYKKVGPVRDAIDAAGRAGQVAIGFIVDKVQDTIDLAAKVVDWFKKKLPDALDFLGDKAKAIGDILLAPFQALMDIVGNVIDLIKNIKLPDIPDWVPGFRQAATGSSSIGLPTLTAGGTGIVPNVTVQLTVQGFVGDEDLLVAKLEKAFARAGRQLALP